MIKNIINTSNIYNIIKNNSVLNTFTIEYRDEIRYNEFMENNINQLKLKSINENIDEKISTLQELEYESDFRITPLYSQKDQEERVKIKSLHL